MKSEGNMNDAFKAGIWYTISTLVVKSISFLSTPLYTRMMSVSEYGIFATFTTLYSLLSILCSLNVGYSIGRAKVDFKDRFKNYISFLQILSSIITILLFILIFIFKDFVLKFTGLNYKYLILLFIYVIFGVTISINQSGYRFSYLYKQNIAVSLFVSVGTVIFSLIFLFLMKENGFGRILGTVFPVVIVGIYFTINNIRNNLFEFKKEYLVYALSLSIPLIFHSLSVYVLGQSDRLMIKNFCGDVDTGIYSLIYQYSILISLITNSINQSWNPWFHDNYGIGNLSIIKEKVKPLVLFGGFIGVCCTGIAPEAVILLGGENYLSGVKAVFPIALGVVCEFVYTQYVIIEMHMKKTKYISIGTSFAAIVNIVLNYIFIPRFGFIAAAYTTLFSYIVLLVIHNFVTRFLLKIHLYDDWYMYFVLITVAVLGYISVMLYKFVLIRYIIGVIFVVLFICYNKNFIKSKIKLRR